jgi:histidine triad (HIT) family protein
MRFWLWLARSWVGRHIVGWVFSNMSFAIPITRLRETETLLAFHHPKPSYPLHILLIPKKSIRSLMDLTEFDHDFLIEVFHTVQSLVKEFNLTEIGYRLVLNGGEYQEIPHLHFHLISGIITPGKREIS